MDDNQNTHQNIKDEEQGIIEETPLSNNTDYIPIITENNYENQQQINIDSVNHQSEYKYTSIDTESFTSDKLNEKVDVDNFHTENQVNKQKSDGQENNDGIETGNDAPGIFTYFTKSSEENIEAPLTVEYSKEEEVSDENSERKMTDDYMDEKIDKDDFCIKTSTSFEHFPMELPNFGADFFLYLVTTAISVIIFMLGYLALDKSRREGPLIAKINKLEKEYLIAIREKEILAEEAENGIQKQDLVSSQEFLNLKQCYEDVVKEKLEMEDQIQTLEKELENSTEVGLELNRMLSDILSSENAGETLMTTIEGLQAQLAEQQGIVSNMKETLSLKETENHELNLDLDITNKKVVELQSELDKLLLNVIKVEEEKELQEKSFKSEIIDLKGKIDSLTEKLEQNQTECEKKIYELEHNLQLKIKEYDGLKNGIQRMKDNKKANNLESLVEVTSIKAELEQLEAEYQVNVENLRREKEINSILEKRTKHAEDEVEVIKGRFDEADKARLELETKLQVLTNYFKEKEAQLQKELTKYESMWSAKQGEATSTSERIKYLQSEVQNYKAQNESLKQEIISQEVELKSQISVLEKKVHENWVSARQAERRLEDVKQEAAQLRNRLTLRERALQEDKTHNRMQSPLEQNPDLPMSPLHMESPSSPPLLYSSRDHITKSPPILGMPPPFLPPPPGGPFLPPPHLSFMPPPPPDMFPGDHRPPPLGRMSSPPLNSRFSPGRSYSPYERSPSPSYDESEYGTSPVHHRRYSPFSERKNHRRMPKSSMGKINGNGAMSSGSNDSLDDINHSNSKV
ncbi:hypothetical protein HHI36_009372 [Cryptolaemus montrouzieri]|uniref:Transport and Golgi organization protein 1 n=1 Tax=Cryptolaemus montrouzieri TaxID=559131 RepID=A0ABD2MV66_9CUCU